MQEMTEKYFGREFWAKENMKYAAPHFRLEKSARLITRIAGGKKCDLLDVGCGPAALMPLLPAGIRYHGIDMAIHNPAPFLIESNFAKQPISFMGKKFDIVLAQGVFEYIGSLQPQKFSEIKGILKRDGKFLVSYVNFDHRKPVFYERYNNIMPFREFKKSLEKDFNVERVVPTSHHWHHREPSRPWVKKVQMHSNWSIPVISQLFAIEYFFICSPK